MELPQVLLARGLLNPSSEEDEVPHVEAEELQRLSYLICSGHASCFVNLHDGRSIVLLLVVLLGPEPGKEMLELALEEADLLLLLGINIMLVLICIASIIT